MSREITLGISTCPNDTFAFHALLAGEVRIPGVELSIELADIEELNARMLAGELDVAKVSAAAALGMPAVALPCGWALGRGMGPVLLGAPGRNDPEDPTADGSPPRVLSPGARTTATLLWRLFHAEPVRLEHVCFSEILPALEHGRADFGICIHEARFTWREHGLSLVEDLGETWDRHSGAPLPLGGLVARRSLPEETLRALVAGVRESLQWGLSNRAATLPTMRRHAQEHTDVVLWSHVELYVNEWTLDWGQTGRAALDALTRLAAERDLLPPSQERLSVWEESP